MRRLLPLLFVMLVAVLSLSGQNVPGTFTPIQSALEPLPGCAVAVQGQSQPLIYDITASLLKTCSAANTWSSITPALAATFLTADGTGTPPANYQVLTAGTNITLTPNPGAHTMVVTASGGASTTATYATVDATGTPPTNYQVITAGANITLTPNAGAHTLTIAGAGGVTTNVQSPGSDTLSANGTFATTFTISANTAAVGDTYEVIINGVENVNSGGDHKYQLTLGGSGLTVAIGHSQSTGSNFNWALVCKASVLKIGSTGRATATCYASQDNQSACATDTCAANGGVPTTVNFTTNESFAIVLSGMAASDTAQLLNMVMKKL